MFTTPVLNMILLLTILMYFNVFTYISVYLCTYREVVVYLYIYIYRYIYINIPLYTGTLRHRHENTKKKQNNRIIEINNNRK